MSTAQTDRDHARLAPSAMHRVVNCPGSLAVESMLPDSSGSAAKEGTAAHELAAWCLKMKYDAAYMRGRVVDITATDVARRFLLNGAPLQGDDRWPVTDEMVEHVQTYIDHVRSLGSQYVIEERLDIAHVHEGIWGTADAIVYDEAGKHLHIVDLKYGRGELVEAEGNPQLRLYASGAVKHFHNVGPIETVTAWIVQPRADHPKGPIRSETLTVTELDAAVAQIGQGAARAVEAAKSYFPTPATAALKRQMEVWATENLAAGGWCRFCKAGATCPARAEQAIRDAQAEFSDTGQLAPREPAQMAPQAVADLLGKARQIQHWIKSVEEFAHAEATAGRMPPGYKLVASKSMRRWKDEESLLAAAPVMLSIGSDDMFAERKVLSPAQLEKKLSPAERKALAAFVESVSSGTNLVPDTDPRAAVRPSAETEFQNMTTTDEQR